MFSKVAKTWNSLSNYNDYSAPSARLALRSWPLYRIAEGIVRWTLISIPCDSGNQRFDPLVYAPNPTATRRSLLDDYQTSTTQQFERKSRNESPSSRSFGLTCQSRLLQCYFSSR